MRNPGQMYQTPIHRVPELTVNFKRWPGHGYIFFLWHWINWMRILIKRGCLFSAQLTFQVHMQAVWISQMHNTCMIVGRYRNVQRMLVINIWMVAMSCCFPHQRIVTIGWNWPIFYRALPIRTQVSNQTMACPAKICPCLRNLKFSQI